MAKTLSAPLVFVVLILLLVSQNAAAAITAGVEATPATINVGESTTITFTFSGGPGDTITVSEFRVFQVSSATPSTYTGTLPSFTCGPKAPCTGTFTVVFPMSKPAACAVTGAGATCTPAKPAACTTARCWSGAVTTAFPGDYLLSVTFGTRSVTNQFTVVAGCGDSDNEIDSCVGVPQFTAPVIIVASLALVGVSVMRRLRMGGF
jgi:hypothetical protein